MIWKTPQLRPAWRIAIAIFAVVSLVSIDFIGQTRTAQAGSLGTTHVYLGRQITNATAGNSLEVFFTTSGSGTTTNGKVLIIFPNNASNNTKWCRTTGADLVATAATDPQGATGAESATGLPGTLAVPSCAQATPDTITVTFSGTINNGTRYGVRIAQAGSPTATLGTANTTGQINVTVKTQTGAAADIDTGTATIALITNDQVSVTASVQPTLTVTLSGNAVGLGTLDSTKINYVGITSQVSANGVGGYVSLVNYDATLTATGGTIADAGGSVTAGTAGYGASSSNSTAGVALATSNASPSCDTTQRQQTGTANATSLTTAFQAYAVSASPVSNETTTLCFLAAIAFDSVPGSYTSTSTVVTTGRF